MCLNFNKEKKMKLTKKLLATALFGASVFSFHSTAWADTQEQQFQQGFEATTRGDYKIAFKLWLPLAEQGDVAAQNNLGLMYENGQGVKQDYAEAVKWYRKAAEQGNANTQFNLGVMYSNGKGVKQDDVEAVKWYRKAAEQGDASAQFNLGVSYYKGKGVKRNPSKAKEWFRKACDNGDQNACDALRKLEK